MQVIVRKAEQGLGSSGLAQDLTWLRATAPVSVCPCVTALSMRACRWRMPVELAVDLSALVLYDIVIYADDSGSMMHLY